MPRPHLPHLLLKPTPLLCLVGVLLPNALFLGALLAGIGTPPRTSAIFAYATVALLARLMPPWLIVPLFLGVAVYDGIATLALLFNLAPSEIATALHLSADLKLFESPLYIALVFGSAALLITNLIALVWTRRIIQKGNSLIMVGVAVVFGAADFLMNTSPHYHYGTLYGAGQPMESATESSGFRSTVLAHPGHHVLLVIVEALGQFKDPDTQAILLQPFRNPDLLQRYAVTTGSTTYYGSTTAAEMRELCNTREPYQSILEGKTFDCLPQQMAAHGYRTTALHNFGSGFFDRAAWYPRVGFETLTFGESLAGVSERRCGGPFRGICDADLIPLIGRQLRDASAPTFAYWLTLSTHVPIAPREGTPRLGCTNGSPIGSAEVCYMTEMWLDVFQGLAALTATLPPTEILIVGDHAPPLWSKAARGLFVPGKVPWIRLTPRISQPAG